MGYNIKIGQASQYTEDGQKFWQISDECHDTAPADGVPTDYTNERWPTYSAWEKFVDVCDLWDTFYNPDTGLMRSEDVPVPITQEHHDAIMAAVAPKSEIHHQQRLQWLQYWINWAFKNLEAPMFFHN